MAKLKIRGLAEMKDRLKNIPPRLLKNSLRAAVRQGANVIKDAAVALAPVESGALRASIKVVPRKGTPTQVVYSVAAGGDFTAAKKRKFGIDAPFYAYFVEHGHLNRKKGDALKGGSRRKTARRAALIEYGAPQTPPHPFLRPALESHAQQALDVMVSVLREKLPEDAGPT